MSCIYNFKCSCSHTEIYKETDEINFNNMIFTNIDTIMIHDMIKEVFSEIFSIILFVLKF